MKYLLKVKNNAVWCPLCNHYNAMLLKYIEREPVWICRDCGFVVPERDVIFENADMEV